MTKNIIIYYIISGILSGLCIYNELLLMIWPGIVYGSFFAFQQLFLRGIYKKLYLVSATSFIYYMALVLAIHQFDFLSFLSIAKETKVQLRFFSAGLFGAVMLWALLYLLGKRSINIRKSLFTICGGGIAGLMFYALDSPLGIIFSFTLWQTIVGVGLHESFE